MPFFRKSASALLLAGLLCGLSAAAVQTSYASTRAQKVTYVTRAEAAQLLLKRSNRILPTLINDGEYPDVLDSEPYAKYVLYAAEIEMWDADLYTNRLRPHKPISRGEYLQMLAKVFELPLDLEHNFRDVQSENWDAPYAGIAKTYGLFYDERDEYRLRSELPVTHQEAAENLYTLFHGRPDLRPPHRIQIHKVVYEDTGSSRAVPEHPDRDVLHSYTTVTSRNQIRESLQHVKEETKSNAEIIAERIIAAVNVERAKAYLPPLTENKELQSSAEKHAKDMSLRGYFSHFTPDGSSFVDRIKASGYTDVDPIECGCPQVVSAPDERDMREETKPDYILYSRDVCSCQPKFALGENLAKGQLTAEESVRDWMNSEGHRANIMHSAFSEIGVGIFREMWVQNFGSFELVLP